MVEHVHLLLGVLVQTPLQTGIRSDEAHLEFGDLAVIVIINFEWGALSREGGRLLMRDRLLRYGRDAKHVSIMFGGVGSRFLGKVEFVDDGVNRFVAVAVGLTMKSSERHVLILCDGGNTTQRLHAGRTVVAVAMIEARFVTPGALVTGFDEAFQMFPRRVLLGRRFSFVPSGRRVVVEREGFQGRSFVQTYDVICMLHFHSNKMYVLVPTRKLNVMFRDGPPQVLSHQLPFYVPPISIPDRFQSCRRRSWLT